MMKEKPTVKNFAPQTSTNESGWNLPVLTPEVQDAYKAYQTLRTRPVRKRRGLHLRDFESYPLSDPFYAIAYHQDNQHLTGEAALKALAEEGVQISFIPATQPYTPTNPASLSPMARLHSAFLQFEAAQAAFRTQALQVNIPENHTLTGRLELRIQSKPLQTVIPEVHLTLGKGSAGNITLHIETPKQSALIGRAVIQAGEDVNFTLISWHETDTESRQWFNHRLHADRDARIKWVNIVDGTGTVELHNHTILKAPGAEVLMRGLSMGIQQARSIIFSTQEHIQGKNHSDLLYKTVLDDESRAFYDGLIRIHEKAQQANAYQKNSNLLLSPHTRTDTVPNLEIMANDVRCTHGATVGRVDRDQLYYLRTRGLTEKEAERLLIIGFCQEILNDMPAFAQETLEERIHQLGHFA